MAREKLRMAVKAIGVGDELFYDYGYRYVIKTAFRAMSKLIVLQ